MKIAHIADIHFRSLTRHDEYKKTFQFFIDDIKKRGVEYVWVGGDIFHTKTTGISPEFIELASWWIRSISKVCELLARFFDDRGQQLIGELGEVGLSGEIAGAGLLDQFLQIGQLPLAEKLGEQRGVEPGLVDCQLQQFHEAAPRHLRAEFGQHPQRLLDASEPPIGLGHPLRTGLSGGGGGGRG